MSMHNKFDERLVQTTCASQGIVYRRHERPKKRLWIFLKKSFWSIFIRSKSFIHQKSMSSEASRVIYRVIHQYTPFFYRPNRKCIEKSVGTTKKNIHSYYSMPNFRHLRKYLQYFKIEKVPFFIVFYDFPSSNDSLLQRKNNFLKFWGSKNRILRKRLETEQSRRWA